jgi:hypothetical protein
MKNKQKYRQLKDYFYQSAIFIKIQNIFHIERIGMLNVCFSSKIGNKLRAHTKNSFEENGRFARI